MKKLILLSVFILACMLPFLQSNDLSNSREPANSTIYDYSSDYDDLNLQKIKDILDQNSIGSIESLLAYLNKNFPGFMERHTYVFDSRSLHESSYENPRAIVYGKSANFILTFNGHPTQEGYQKLEVAQFDSNKKKYDFTEIEFLSSLSNKRYSISAPGGPDQVCMQCHVGGKPIWDTYDLWPGVYGSVDEEPLRASRKPFLPPLPGVSNGIYLGGEKNMWMKFQKLRVNHGRYKWLPAPTSKNNSLYDHQGDIFFPNTELSVKIARNNLQRVLQEIRLQKNKFSSEIVSQVLFSFDCRRTNNPEINSAIKRLNNYYQKPITEIERQLENRMMDVLLRYSKAPYFDRKYLSTFLTYNTKAIELRKAEGFQITNDSGTNKMITDELGNLLDCIKSSSTWEASDSEIAKCANQYKTPEFDKVQLITFYEWLYKNKLLGDKTKARRIAIAVAIINGNRLGLSTDSWSTLQFGEHDYATGSGIEETIFRNGFTEIFNIDKEVYGGNDSTGVYVLKKGREKSAMPLSENEIGTYCSDLANSIKL